jgi:hypothetical protein
MLRQARILRRQLLGIHNGADQRIFNAKDLTSWDGKGKLRLVCYSWSGNPAKGHLTLSRLSELDDIEVDFAGNWPKDVPTKKRQDNGTPGAGQD